MTFQKWIWGGRTKRIRNHCIKHLESVGSATTAELLEHINKSMFAGTTMNQICNVLSKDPRFTEFGTEPTQARDGGAYLIQRYELAEDYQEWKYR